MCLHLNPDAELFTAEEDIIVYKLLLKSVWKSGDEDFCNYKSPFRWFDYELGKEYEAELERVDRNSYGVNESYVDAGLHSYINYATVQRAHTRSVEAIHDNDVHVTMVAAECVIPKGAQYYVGTFNSEGSIASSKLKFVRVLGKDYVP